MLGFRSSRFQYSGLPFSLHHGPRGPIPTLRWQPQLAHLLSRAQPNTGLRPINWHRNHSVTTSHPGSAIPPQQKGACLAHTSLFFKGPSNRRLADVRSRLPDLPRTLDQPRTRVAHWPRPRLALASVEASTRHSMDDKQRATRMERWGQILRLLEPYSPVSQALSASRHPAQFLELSVSRFATTTLTNYLRCIGQFLDYLGTSGMDISSLQLVDLSDFLLACQSGLDEDRSANHADPKAMLKAISWLQKCAQLSVLQTVIHNPLIQSFHTTSKPSDRREAVAIPLAVLVAWEIRVCSPSCPESLRLFLERMLLAAHASLRFGDLQRIVMEDLSLASNRLRGSCWATKTSSTGQPFAITLFGLSGRDLSSAWTIHWLVSVASGLARANHMHGETSLSQQQELPPTYTTPMPYCHALATIRWAAQTPWSSAPCLTPGEASALTLHSLKVTYLSAALQLRLPEEDRRVQGHHKISSVRLYSRDDTHQALWVQRQLADAVRTGWRPSRLIVRGANIRSSSQASRSPPRPSPTPWTCGRPRQHSPASSTRGSSASQGNL